MVAKPDGAGTASEFLLDAVGLAPGCTLRQGLYHGLRTDDLVQPVPQGPQGPFEAGRLVSVSSAAWTTVTLNRAYASMVVVATPECATTGVPPIVTRIRNATGNQFEVTLARADNVSGAVTAPVHYLVVDEGQYTADTTGVKLEAVRFSSTVTDRSDRERSKPRLSEQLHQSSRGGPGDDQQ